LIVDPAKKSMLLIRHKTLGRWFQPGGHLEKDESPQSAALREASEETGIPASHLCAACAGDDTPLDIDSHPIPASPAKNEPAHVHHDLRYLFTCTHATPLNFDDKEVTGCRWVPLGELSCDPEFRALVKKINQVLQSFA